METTEDVGCQKPLAKITTTRLWEGRLSAHEVSGVVTYRDLLDSVDEEIPDPECPDLNTLWDLTQADLSNTSLQEAREFVAQILAAPNRPRTSRTAVVLSGDLVCGLGRMRRALVEIEQYPLHIRSFSDLSHALEWLEGGGIGSGRLKEQYALALDRVEKSRAKHSSAPKSG